MQLNSLTNIEKYLKKRIPSRSALFCGDVGLKRTKEFMRRLNNPQEKLRVIHIAGTSGKGSTAYIISSLLIGQKFKTGLQLSPHILDIRERFQINNELISEKKIIKYFNDIMPLIEKMDNEYPDGGPTYFETLVGLAFYIFAKEKVDFAIMETGLGGTLDGTNVVQNPDKISVITPIGLDHTEILGNTVKKIALQKAGIIQKGNLVVSAMQMADAKIVIDKTCREKNVAPVYLDNNIFSNIIFSENSSYFTFYYENFKKINISLNLIGKHQIENAGLSLVTLIEAANKYKFKIKKKAILNSLSNLQFAGRMEKIKLNGKEIICDGAHNPQKMGALVASLMQIFPNQKFTFIIAFRHQKEFKPMLKAIIPISQKIYCTEFSLTQDGPITSTPLKDIESFLLKNKFSNYEILENNKASIINAIYNSENKIVITGSFYLLASIYKFIKN